MNSTGARSGERELADLVHQLDVLTAALNAVRQNRANELAGAVRWMLPRVATERARAQDRLNLERAR